VHSWRGIRGANTQRDLRCIHVVGEGSEEQTLRGISGTQLEREKRCNLKGSSVHSWEGSEVQIQRDFRCIGGGIKGANTEGSQVHSVAGVGAEVQTQQRDLRFIEEREKRCKLRSQLHRWGGSVQTQRDLSCIYGEGAEVLTQRVQTKRDFMCTVGRGQKS
jgi:hypothetical protein